MHMQLDHPICDPTDDTLGRVKLAEEFAGNIAELSVKSGVVVGILGPWGAGKTGTPSF